MIYITRLLAQLSSYDILVISASAPVLYKDLTTGNLGVLVGVLK